MAVTISGLDPGKCQSFAKVFSNVLAPHLDDIVQLRSLALHIQQQGMPFWDFWLWTLLLISEPHSLCLAWDKCVSISPKIRSLKHLRLEVKTPFEINWADIVQQPNLETLTICSDIPSDDRSPKVSQVDLRPATKLRKVTFLLLLPGRLSVPAGCEVHIVCHSAQNVFGAWKEGLGDVCKSCELFQELPGLRASSRSKPAMLRRMQHITKRMCPQLTALKLHCKDLGSEKASFVVSDTLPNLETLEVTAKDNISLSFGADAHLRVLRTLTGNGLFLEFKDILAFTDRLESFKYKFTKCSEMTQQWVEQLLRKTNRVGSNACGGSRLFVEEQCHEECACGTCVDCVRRIYMPQSRHPLFPFVGLFK